MSKNIDRRLLIKKEEQAYRLIELGARPTVVVSVVGKEFINSNKANLIYREIFNTNSPKGQLPRTPDYFVRGPKANLHSTCLLRFYRTFRKYSTSQDEAFAKAFIFYRHRFGKEAYLNINRLWSLLLSVDCFKELFEVKCDRCHAPYLQRKYEVKNDKRCPFCKANSQLQGGTMQQIAATLSNAQFDSEEVIDEVATPKFKSAVGQRELF